MNIDEGELDNEEEEENVSDDGFDEEEYDEEFEEELNRRFSALEKQGISYDDLNSSDEESEGDMQQVDSNFLNSEVQRRELLEEVKRNLSSTTDYILTNWNKLQEEVRCISNSTSEWDVTKNMDDSLETRETLNCQKMDESSEMFDSEILKDAIADTVNDNVETVPLIETLSQTKNEKVQVEVKERREDMQRKKQMIEARIEEKRRRMKEKQELFEREQNRLEAERRERERLIEHYRLEKEKQLLEQERKQQELRREKLELERKRILDERKRREAEKTLKVQEEQRRLESERKKVEELEQKRIEKEAQRKQLEEEERKLREAIQQQKETEEEEVTREYFVLDVKDENNVDDEFDTDKIQDYPSSKEEQESCNNGSEEREYSEEYEDIEETHSSSETRNLIIHHEASYNQETEKNDTFSSLSDGEGEQMFMIESEKEEQSVEKHRIHSTEYSSPQDQNLNVVIKREEQLSTKAVMTIVKFFRRCKEKRTSRSKAAAISIQRLWRGYMTRKHVYPWLLPLLRKRIDAACQIQALWKGYYVRQLIKKAKQLEKEYLFELGDLNENFDDDIRFLDDTNNFDLVGTIPSIRTTRIYYLNSDHQSSSILPLSERKSPIIRQNWVDLKETSEPNHSNYQTTEQNREELAGENSESKIGEIHQETQDKSQEVSKQQNTSRNTIAEEWGFENASLVKAFLKSKRRKPKNHKKRNEDAMDRLNRFYRKAHLDIVNPSITKTRDVLDQERLELESISSSSSTELPLKYGSSNSTTLVKPKDQKVKLPSIRSNHRSALK